MSWLVKPCSSVEEHVKHEPSITIHTWLAQSVERQPFKLVVEGSSPSSGVSPGKTRSIPQKQFDSSTKNYRHCFRSSVGSSIRLLIERSQVRALPKANWFYGVTVSTSPLHGLDTGSIPVRTTRVPVYS